MNEVLPWLKDTKAKVVCFVNALKEESVPGFYRYSYSGDLKRPSRDWGLANCPQSLFPDPS